MHRIFKFCVPRDVVLLWAHVFNHRQDIETEADVASRLGVIYMATFFAGVICFETAIPTGAKERIVFYREQARPSYCCTPPNREPTSQAA